MPETEYVSHLLDDLAEDAKLVGDRAIHSIFIGGGTPSLFSAQSIKSLLDGVKDRVNLLADAEITMEANPGTVESQRFADYVKAGITRISIAPLAPICYSKKCKKHYKTNGFCNFETKV